MFLLWGGGEMEIGQLSSVFVVVEPFPLLIIKKKVKLDGEIKPCE